MTFFKTLPLVFVLSLSAWGFSASAVPGELTPTVLKTTGVVFKLNNNCGSKQGVEVNGKAFQMPNGTSRRFDYPAGTKIYKLNNGVRGALLYTVNASHAGKVLPVCP